MTVDSSPIRTLRSGTWTIDPVHSAVSFTARHLGVAKVHGTFDALAGTITTTEDPRPSRAKGARSSRCRDASRSRSVGLWLVALRFIEAPQAWAGRAWRRSW